MPEGHFPYATISSWFEENGDFPENLEEPDALDQQREDAIAIAITVDAPVCEPCIDEDDADIDFNEEAEVYPYPEDLQEEHFPNDDHTPYATKEEAEAVSGNAWEPCCYNSTRNFGTGDHEWGCPNY
jgi:hypothetical protein